jgi:prolipoprotein diacylglyceryltransferase
MALLMVAYPVTRFLIEYLRNDEKVFLFGLTISQNISILLEGAGLLFWFWLLRRGAARPPSEHGRRLGRSVTLSGEATEVVAN